MKDESGRVVCFRLLRPLFFQEIASYVDTFRLSFRADAGLFRSGFSTLYPASRSERFFAALACCIRARTISPLGWQKCRKTLDAKREEFHVPGAALVIVKDDKIVAIQGMGLRDVEHKLPVTPQTLFAIGSSTKAFTAMTALMSVDDGKLSLSDSPRKYLPYFKLKDPDADAKITVSDLLCHRSGLDRTELAWYTGKLARRK